MPLGDLGKSFKQPLGKRRFVYRVIQGLTHAHIFCGATVGVKDDDWMLKTQNVNRLRNLACEFRQ